MSYLQQKELLEKRADLNAIEEQRKAGLVKETPYRYR
jgi:hypothetical protein